MTYDPTKEYRTKCGFEVMLLPELDCVGNLHGMYRDAGGCWQATLWNGKTLQNKDCKPELDLIEKPKTHVRWLHLVEYSNSVFSCHPMTERKPPEHFASKLVAVKRVEIAEGEGLDDE